MLLNGVATVEVSRWHYDRKTTPGMKVVNIYNNDPVRITPKRIYWREKVFDRETGDCVSAYYPGQRYQFKITAHQLNADTRPKAEPGTITTASGESASCCGPKPVFAHVDESGPFDTERYRK